MLKNQRGEVVTIVLLTILGVFVVAQQVPLIGRVFSTGASASIKAPAEEAWKEQKRVVEPVTVGLTPTGEKVVAYREVQTFSSGASKSAAKLTYGERVGEFFSNLTIWGLIAVAFAFFVLGITPGMIFNNLRVRAQKAMENERAEKAKMEQTLTKTVMALQKVDDDTWKTKLKPLLDEAQDKQDRDLIKDIKKKIDV